jgi:hypothetical protein
MNPAISLRRSFSVRNPVISSDALKYVSTRLQSASRRFWSFPEWLRPAFPHVFRFVVVFQSFSASSLKVGSVVSPPPRVGPHGIGRRKSTRDPQSHTPRSHGSHQRNLLSTCMLKLLLCPYLPFRGCGLCGNAGLSHSGNDQKRQRSGNVSDSECLPNAANSKNDRQEGFETIIGPARRLTSEVVSRVPQ